MPIYLGRHEAAKEICDQASKIFEKQQQKAASCRYHNMALDIQGNINYIYHADYDNSFVAMFAEDNINNY